MKIVLIQPQSSNPLMDQVYLFEPLALEYLGAGLKLDGHSVEIIDARLEPDIEDACRRFQPNLVGLTGFTAFWRRSAGDIWITDANCDKPGIFIMEIT